MTERLDTTDVRAGVQRVPGHRSARAGLCYGIAAYTMWGIFPLYFHLVSEVPSWLVLCHRIFWSVLFLAVVVSVRKEWGSILPILRNRRNMVLLTAGGVLIALNWLLFIYSVASHQVLASQPGLLHQPAAVGGAGHDLPP